MIVKFPMGSGEEELMIVIPLDSAQNVISPIIREDGT